jgi:type IX secretion system substrate protein
MKKHYLLLLLIWVMSFSFLQSQTNLVPNPSFEIHDTCPNTEDYITYSTHWYPSASDLANYFNVCATNPVFSVPDNIAGYQYAASGNAYAGLASYISAVYTPSNYTEIIGTQLVSSLIVGQKYYIKFKLNCAIGGDGSNTAIDKMGIRFTMIQHNSTNNTTPINNFADVYATSIVSDTTNWTQIFGSFVADSAYSYIEVGNFFDYLHTNTQIIKSSGGSANTSFYFVDDICVSTDSVYTNNWVWSPTGIEQLTANSKRVTIYPNPSSNGVFYSNTSFINEQAEVYDVLGNLVKQVTLISKNVIDLSDLQNGIYFIAINDETKQKIIINNP